MHEAGGSPQPYLHTEVMRVHVEVQPRTAGQAAVLLYVKQEPLEK